VSIHLRKKRVLLLSEGFGAGHTQAAHALSVSLKQHSTEVQTRVLELGAFLHPTIAPWIFTAYRKTITSQPKLYGRLYRSQYKKSLNRITQLALHRIFYAQTAEIIRQLKPDAIVCTHPFPNAVVSRLKRSGLSIPLCTVITDYDVHGTWVSTEVNKYLVSTEDVKNKLLSRGIPSHQIEITGIPIHPSFREPQDKEAIRAEFTLNNLPTVLIMGGGWGLIDSNGLYAKITQWKDSIQFVICMGSNEKARMKLTEDPRFQHPNIHLLGFTKEIGKLMEVSDLLITKPGGMTCSEGLAKSLPMLFYKPIPGQEEENLHYFTACGFGESIESTDTIEHWFRKLAESYSDVQEHRASISQLSSKYQSIDCTSVIMDLLG
jgi:processive 1,2-diacylglycerol beta-glucosyltransferase